MKTLEATSEEKKVCYHCALDYEDKEVVFFQDKNFCCNGCKVVYELLSENQLCDYYDISKNPGISQRTKVDIQKYAVLDNPAVKNRFIRFSDGECTHVVFYIPQVHCSSCIWLLENLQRLNAAVISSRVDFEKKEVTIIYKEDEIQLHKVAELLAGVGYDPYINLSDISSDKHKKGTDRSLWYRLGVAGFCFGNIMALSFPEYLSGGAIDPQLLELFNYMNFTLSLPVFFYCASIFFKSSWLGFKHGYLHIDAAIAVALIITWVRSSYEILSGTGVGFMDSLSGIVFFMLIGRYLQDKTNEKLTFERDYKSYFPISVTRINKAAPEEIIPVTDIKIGDRILIKNQEIIPADSILLSGIANIDYSFVTGESAPVARHSGEVIYAGGKHIGPAIELEVIKDVSNSYLTELWNKDVFRDYEDKKLSYLHTVSKYFTTVLFSLVTLTGLYWYFYDASRVWSSVSAMLIVACPCTLLLAATFTNGNILRILGRNRFLLKNSTVIEMLSVCNIIVFDKTGTITRNEDVGLSFKGLELNQEQNRWVRLTAQQSSHPYSKAVAAALDVRTNGLKISDVEEVPGKGIQSIVNDHSVRLGSAAFVEVNDVSDGRSAKVYVEIDGSVLGYFAISNKYRSGIPELINSLGKKYELAVLSGDNDSERENLKQLFGEHSALYFNQTPHSKLQRIEAWQNEGKKVIMIGDGLNDAGALKQSDMGIAVSDASNNFSPACDAILDGDELKKLGDYIQYVKSGKKIVMVVFVISILYNVVGLSIAMQGLMSPLIAAVLMPSSSLTVMIISLSASSIAAKRLGLRL